MNKPKYTPGPWGEKAIAAALRAAHEHDGSWIDELGDGENMPDEDDAHLIAAALDMYEAAEAALECLESNGFGKAYVEDLLRTALRKARPCEP